ncbi:MAG: hypothetical protein UT30_C0026G0010 [Candidatus Uhrbacteria bacterium GW2011_GWF2_39_13]|uniref:Uncharacterized protein n=1 Tax=Candidatus Uhrbacteria bacterium GW2011_GWF2_39_13 TaxID=1618995 RepID=A0A0G0PZG8_9BACT|nr:MAG: hypothetical protein UT30_C0026G0010 [Candidatus Uhrbacteria bacterium GW2011_GWF2_39_13]
MKKRRAILKEVLKNGNFKKLDKKTFLNAWKALAFIYVGLHPDEHENPEGGWPKRLKPLAVEVFRRRENGEFTDNELYPSQEVLKGIKARLSQRK